MQVFRQPLSTHALFRRSHQMSPALREPTTLCALLRRLCHGDKRKLFSDEASPGSFGWHSVAQPVYFDYRALGRGLGHFPVGPPLSMTGTFLVRQHDYLKKISKCCERRRRQRKILQFYARWNTIQALLMRALQARAKILQILLIDVYVLTKNQWGMTGAKAKTRGGACPHPGPGLASHWAQATTQHV